MNTWSERLARLEPSLDTSEPVIGYGFHARRRRGQRSWLRRWLGSPTGAETVGTLLTFLALGIAVYSVQQAKWISPQPPLVMILALATVVGLILVKAHLPGRVRMGIGLGLGVLITLWRTAALVKGQSVWHALATNPSQGTIHFATFLILVAWVMGFLSVWLVLQKRNAWLPAGMGALTVLVNLTHLPEEHYFFLPLYLGAALLLVGHTALVDQQGWFSRNGSRFPEGMARYFLTSVVCLSVVAIVAAWFVPAPDTGRLGVRVSGQVLASVNQFWLNIFASVPGKWAIIKSEEMSTLNFSSPQDNRDVVVFIVSTKHPAYWRTMRYDTYYSWGWTSWPTSTEDVKPDVPVGEPTVDGAARHPATYTVEMRSRADVLLVAGEFASADIPVRLQLEAQSGAAPISDIASVLSPEPLRPYDRYTLVTSVSSATAAELTPTGQDYPAWVTGRYLQLPQSLPSRVRQEALTVTRDAATPYEKAVAIQQYLHGLHYNENAPRPTSRRGDETDNFLFVQKEGICTDFATAMAVMLRSVDVPARLVSGYLPGELDDGGDKYLVRAKDYHAWVEVYFTGYGWIEFDPTPGGVTPGDEGTLPGGQTGPVEDLFPEVPYGDSGVLPPTGGARTGNNIVLPLIGLGLLLSSVGIAAWLLVRRWFERLRRSGDVSNVYAKMCWLGSLAEIGPVAAETPLEYCTRLAAAYPSGAAAITDIGQLYIQSSFSPRKDLNETDAARLEKSWVTLYPLLFKRRFPWRLGAS